MTTSIHTANETRRGLERKMILELIRVAKAAGWSIPKVDDGEWVKCSTDQEVIDAVFSVDESGISFKKEFTDSEGIPRTARGTAVIVLGNDGWDCIADHSTGDLFVVEVMDPMDAYSDKLCDECA